MHVRTRGFQSVLLILVVALGVIPGTAASAPFVRVKVDVANVREGPSTKFGLATAAYENEPLRVIARKGRWLHTRNFEGDDGWIYAPLTDAKPAAIVTAKEVNVRSGPGTDHPVVFTAERGVPFLVLDEEGRWLKVEHADGDRGWIYKDLVWGGW